MLKNYYDKTQTDHLSKYNRIIKANVGLQGVNLIYKMITYYLNKTKTAS